jgi:hypothetical protein
VRQSSARRSVCHARRHLVSVRCSDIFFFEFARPRASVRLFGTRAHCSFPLFFFFFSNLDREFFRPAPKDRKSSGFVIREVRSHSFQTECQGENRPSFPTGDSWLTPREAENTSRQNSRAFLRRLWPLKRYSENDKASRRVAAAITFPHHTPSPDTQLPAVVPDWYVDTPRARARGFSDAAPAAARVPPERCRDSASATSRQTRYAGSRTRRARRRGGALRVGTRGLGRANVSSATLASTWTARWLGTAPRDRERARFRKRGTPVAARRRRRQRECRRRARARRADARWRGSGRHRARARPVAPFVEARARARGGGGPRRPPAPRHARPPARILKVSSELSSFVGSAAENERRARPLPAVRSRVARWLEKKKKRLFG